MFKLIALFVAIACTQAQVLRLNPLNLGSINPLGLQTINLGQRLALARSPYLGGIAPQVLAPQVAIANQIAAARGIYAPQIALRGVLEAPEPYTFGFTSVDEFGTQLGRQETADGSGAVVGSYSLAEGDGRQRVVEYVADAAGFRANVRTNEPGTANANPANVNVISTNPQRR